MRIEKRGREPSFLCVDKELLRYVLKEGQKKDRLHKRPLLTWSNTVIG